MRGKSPRRHRHSRGLTDATPCSTTPGYAVESADDTQVLLGAFFEIVLAIAVIGTAVTLYAIVKRQNEGLALGYVARRVSEAVIIAVGIISLLSIVTLGQDSAGAARGPGRLALSDAPLSGCLTHRRPPRAGRALPRDAQLPRVSGSRACAACCGRACPRCADSGRVPGQVSKSTRPYDLVCTGSPRLIADHAVQLGRTAEVQHFSVRGLPGPRAHQPSESCLALAASARPRSPQAPPRCAPPGRVDASTFEGVRLA